MKKNDSQKIIDPIDPSKTQKISIDADDPKMIHGDDDYNLDSKPSEIQNLIEQRLEDDSAEPSDDETVSLEEMAAEEESDLVNADDSNE